MSYNNWFEPNWQQENGPMDHEVSNPGYIGFNTNTNTSGMEYLLHYRPNITLEYCEKLYANETDQMLKTHPNGFCNVSFDKILCWPPTPYNTVAKVKCFSEFLGIKYDDTQNASRECSWNGTWFRSRYDDCTELDVYPTSVETLSNIYLIGYIISSVTLAIAIFIFTYFKELRCLRNKIHMNLLWSYLLTYCMWIVILIQVNFRDHMAVTCVFVVTLLHYFHITTFFWMFVEGLYLYILVVRTLTRESFKLRVYALIGWGTPLFFIVLWAVIKSILLEPAAYDTTCSWFGESKIDYIYQVPTIIVLVINIVFMVSIMVVLVTKLRSANTLEIQQYRKAVKALAVLIPLLGVTYAITIYAPALTIWDMLRSALLSVQGFMVALFYCFLNTEVQNTLKHHFENWKTKKSLGPSRLRSSSRSKDWSPRSRTESLRITEWTLVGAEDIDDNERRMSQSGLHTSQLNHTKESLLLNQRRESVTPQPQTPRRLSESFVAVHHPYSLAQGNKYIGELTVNPLNNREPLMNSAKDSLLTQRKEALVNQPLLEQSEESPTEADQSNMLMTNETDQISMKQLGRKAGLNDSYLQKVSTSDLPSLPPREITVIINHKGESVIIPRNRSNASFKA